MTTSDNTGMGSDTQDPLVGQSIADGRYKIVRVIGEGGMGKVYLGEQKLGDRVRSVAIKTLQPDLAQDSQIVARFHREAGTVSLLEHPNTIKFFESGELSDGKLFVAMEFIQGESLAHVIARGPLAPQRVEHILQQVCGSLGEAHEHGIIHRDLKPENIILTQKGAKGDFVKVLDFGIAKRDEAQEAQDAKLTRQGMVLGTPPYMSPEQFTGQPLKPASDIYSLAVVTYEMLTGKLPFQASTPWEWATKHLTGQPMPFEVHHVGVGLPPRQKTAVMRALSKNPSERPQSMADFLTEFSGGAAAAGDWSSTTGPGGFGGGMVSQQGGMMNPTPPPVTPMGMNQGYPSQPGMASMQGTPSNPGVGATMAVQSYPTPTPFQPPSNPGYPSMGGGFNPVQPPSNPQMPMMGGPSYQGGPYGSQQGYAPPVKPSGGGAAKYIAIGAGLLVLLGGGALVVALASGHDDDHADSGTTNNNNNNNNNNGNNGNNNVPTPSTAMQPIPTPSTTMQPIADPNNGGGTTMQPIADPNNGGGTTMQPIPNPNHGGNTIQPIAPQPRTERPAVCRSAGRIDTLILNGQCPAAQGLFRAMRAAGCAPNPNDHFGSACPAP